jgi:glycerol-3-phosphate acyltransferase PlsY
METTKTIVLAIAAFGLGSIPFSLLVGRWFLHDDIRRYDDGNPGAYNVFRAGGRKSGVLAACLDVGKGMPFVFLVHAVFHLPGTAVAAVGVSAVLGHAFSPFLQGHGGKAVAVTFGVMLALPQHYLLLTFIAFMLIGFIFIETDAWIVIFGAAGTLAFFIFTRGSSWETLLILCLLIVLAIKHFEALHTFPGFHGRLVRWLQTVVRGVLP